MEVFARLRPQTIEMNTEFVRSQFPGLKDDFIFFDNAGGSQIAQQVIDKINDYLVNSYVQLGASYSVSELATKRVAELQNVGQLLLNTQSPAEIVTGSSTTMLLRQLAQAMLKNLKEGDEIIVTNCDHEANIGAWRSLERFGIKIKVWEINKDTFELQLSDLDLLINDRTVLVAFTHASNVLGTINPVKEISAFVHERGALVCVDGVAYAPHRLIDVRDLDVDFYVYSFYKTYGPHQAVLYGKKELLLKLDKLNHYFIGEEAIPYKLQPGNVNHELSYGTTGILDYFNAIAKAHDIDEDIERKTLAAIFKLIATHEEELSQRLLEYLNSKDQIKIIGHSSFDKKLRLPTISFIVEGMNSREITLETDKENIGIRFGDFYARRLIEYLDLTNYEGVVRVSMVHYNTLEEVDKLISTFEEIF
jgi:cysteine desulfurase family protein (TIGR01976 family)